MRSAPLYRLPELERFLAAARTQGFASDEFLGRVLTIELAMREADDSPV